MGCTPSINQSGVVRCQESDRSSSDTNPNNHQMNWLEGSFRRMVSSDEAVESGGSTGNSLQIVSCSKSGIVQSDQNTSWMYRERDLKRTSNTLKFGPMCLTLPTIKVLLVFDKEDSQCKALKLAVEKLQYDYVVVTSDTQALDRIRNSHYHLVIVDTRHPSGFDPFLLARSFRLSKDNHYSCFVAVVKRSLAEKEDSLIFKILNAGFDRWFLESCSLTLCLSELILIEGNEIMTRLKLHATQALFTALENSCDAVLVTGKNQEIQDWEGSGFRKRKTAQHTPMWNKVTPVDVHNGANEHTVLVREGRSSSFYSEKSYIPDCDFLPYTLTNMKSIRNPSFDVRSLCSEAGMNRRQSLARLHTMTIEAPITKVINMLLATQENSPNFVAKDIDKILEILRTSDLYSPQLLGLNQHRRPTDDKLTSDLISSLVMQGQKSGQRRFSHDINQKVSRSSIVSSLASIPSLDSAPRPIVSALEKSMEWSFDIFELERISEKRALTWLGMTVFSSFNACSVLSCDEKTLKSWLTLIEANYYNNPYHNSTHAADVMQATAFFLQKPRLKTIFDPLDEVISLIAAVVHDVNHPGKNSAFLCNTKDELAILYNDLSVLESYHAARAFKLTLSDKNVNILQNLDRDMYQVVRESIIDMVLATEMTKHFEHLSKFVNVLKTIVPNEEAEDDKQLENCQEVLITMSSPENVKLVKRMLIKCADISNAARPTKLCVEWATRITEEYCRQTDEEKAKALPVVMPTFDRTTMSLPKAQLGFIDYFINDMFSSWDAFGDFPELIDHIQSNYQYWKEQDDERQEQEASKEES
ncbi:high affinity cAMP-specific and IBMX-insensitive 3',5'-cyclic phosphodiesterase 8A-like isoform X4 [Limulus polyphemus]|uniref:High affinity cAMP-specific and IBMX-insensitive 3',5'-cyclic phosphodiesterase 8A-like isoform X4 n=1 Tax=Limulus polyphemus TaxID=6850 RepID=A0ABM1SBU3_LIMPO|nr:high affinity cAMP-specific and IBMX-insensitive 3',5'-cyclic phosphodiesterase 8A-like isoform X4 [Limulus polyphemus]